MAAVVGVLTSTASSVPPTTYTQGTTIGGVFTSVIVTFIPTTPTTPIPTWTSSGNVLSVNQYISTTLTASQFTLLSSASSAFSDTWLSILSKSSMFAFAIVGGLVGAAVVL